MKIPPPIVTREHGAWAVLLVPLLTGFALSEQIRMNHLYLFISALFFFLSYAPAQTVLRHRSRQRSEDNVPHAATLWGGVFVTLGFAFAAPLVLRGYFLLVPMGAVTIALFAANHLLFQRYGKTLAGDLLGMLALTVGAPAALYVGSASLDERHVILWFLNFFFFASGAFYVHMKIGAAGVKQSSLAPAEKVRLGYHNLLYHVIMFGVLGLSIMVTSTSAILLLAFVPITVHALYGTISLSPRVNFKRLGLILLGHSILFCVLLISSFS